MASEKIAVVIAVDHSPFSEQACRFYLKEMYKPGVQVYCVHVHEYWSNADHSLSPARWQEVVDETKSKAQEVVDKYNAILAEYGAEGKCIAHHSNKPWEGIIKAAEEYHASCIVIGSRGMGKLRRTILGSVSDGVVHHSNVPVLVWKPTDQHKH